MSQEGNRIKWDVETGSIKLISDGNEERVFTMSRDFTEEFKKELINTSGESTFKMTIRKLLEKLGKDASGDISWESFTGYNDEQILPATAENLPADYDAWDGKTRNLVLKPDVPMEIWTVKSFQVFKEILTDIMTEKGASAIINSTGKKAGMAIGPQFAKYHGWSTLEDAIGTIGEVTKKMHPLTGWSKADAVTQKGSDGKDMIVIKASNSYETEGHKSSSFLCNITSSLINGIWNSYADILGGQSAEAREVMCTAKGDGTCAYAIKFKDKGAPPLDWKELESEWKALVG